MIRRFIWRWKIRMHAHHVGSLGLPDSRMPDAVKSDMDGSMLWIVWWYKGHWDWMMGTIR